MRNIRRLVLMANNSIVNKIWEVLGMGKESAQDVEDSEIYMDDTDASAYGEEPETEELNENKGLFGIKKSTKAIQQETQDAVRMVITQPTEVDEASEICYLLRARKSIVMNLEYANKDVARRIVDIVSGAVAVLNGRILKITNAIFLVAPSNYDIDDGSNEDVKKNPLASFMSK
jgi:cell division inhibitor SepF